MSSWMVSLRGWIARSLVRRSGPVYARKRAHTAVNSLLLRLGRRRPSFRKL
jgi:hypothetical protein